MASFDVTILEFLLTKSVKLICMFREQRDTKPAMGTLVFVLEIMEIFSRFLNGRITQILA